MASRLTDRPRRRSLRPWLGVALAVVFAGVAVGPVGGQPPGTLPSPQAIGMNPPGEGTATESAQGVIPKMFLVLDEAGNPVAVPGMTFERLDDLLRMKEGWLQSAQPYSIESLEVRGRVLATSAELTVTVRIELGPTGGKWVSVPLKMGNFHRTGPADISGVERYRMDLAEDGGGHVLHLESATSRSVVVAMRVVTRVSAPPTSAIEFQLPDAPSLVVLDLPSSGVSANVIGQGDEVLSTQSSPSETEVTLSGRGGDFGLRFGSQIPQVDTRPLLESESRIVVDWQQADSTPLVAHELSVRSLQGDLAGCELNLPAGVSLLQQPTIRGGGPFEIGEPIDPEPIADGPEANNPASVTRGATVLVSPMEGQGDSRVEISLATQLRTLGERPGAKVMIRGVEVTDAIEQTGEIEIRVPRDFRLRWESRPWITSLWDRAEAESLATRTYRFRFDRMPFELPVWLSARTERLRVEGDFRLTFYDSLVSLKLQLRTTGGVPDSRTLPLDIGDWKVQTVLIGGTSTPVDTEQNDQMLEIDLSSLPAGGESDRIEITLAQSIAEDQDRIDLALPRITGDPSLIGTIASSLSVVTEADYRFVADLTASRGIGEVLRVYGPVPAAEPTTGADVTDSVRLGADLLGGLSPTTKPAPIPRLVDSAYENRYALPDISQPGRLVGFLVTERPGISYQAEVEVSIEGNQLIEVIHWTLYPRSRLRGRLPIIWAETQPVGPDGEPAMVDVPPTNAGEATKAGEESVYRLASAPLWSVTVDDAPAVLRSGVGGDHAVLSEALASGPHRIRLRRSRELPPELLTMKASENGQRLAGLVLPRPEVSDLSLLGPIAIRLRSDRGLELTSRDSQSRWSDDLKFASLPAVELPLRLRRVDGDRDDITIRRAWMQTAVSRELQYDHLVASVQGGGLLRLRLGPGSQAARLRASVDGQAVEVLRESADACLVRLGEPGSHAVVVQLYQPRTASIFSEQIRPVLELPTSAERVFWEVVTPRDDHLIWYTPILGQAMTWQFDRWHLHRQPLQTTAELAVWAGGQPDDSRLPQGNRYLFVAVEASGLRAVTMSRLAIWMLVGTAVLGVSCLLTYYPMLRHPLLAMFAAVLLGGLTWLLPDASVLVAQVMLIAMLMVGVIAGVGHLLVPRRPGRVLVPGGDRSSLRGRMPQASGGGLALATSAGPPSITAAVPGRGSTAEAS